MTVKIVVYEEPFMVAKEVDYPHTPQQLEDALDEAQYTLTQAIENNRLMQDAAARSPNIRARRGNKRSRF